MRSRRQGGEPLVRVPRVSLLLSVSRSPPFPSLSFSLLLWEKPEQEESSGGGGGLFFFLRSRGGGSVFGKKLNYYNFKHLPPPPPPPSPRGGGRIPQGRMCVRKRGGYRPPDLFNAKIVSI